MEKENEVVSMGWPECNDPNWLALNHADLGKTATQNRDRYIKAEANCAALEAENAALREKLAAAEALREDLCDRSLNVLDYVMSAQESMRGVGIKQNDFPEMFADFLAASAAPAAQEDAKDAARYRFMKFNDMTLEYSEFISDRLNGIGGDDFNVGIDAAIAANTPKGT